MLIDTQGLEYEYDFAVADGASATARVGRPAHVAVTSSGQPLIAATADVASGLGTRAVGAYPVNPATDLPGSDAGTRYFDVRLVPRDSSSQFAALQVTVSNVTDTEQTPYWYDKGAGLWEPMTGASPTYDATNHTLTLTFTPTSLPALDAFSGTYIAVGPAAGTPPGPGGGGTATPELSSGELFATGIVPLGLVLLFRRRRGRSRGNRRAHVA